MSCGVATAPVTGNCKVVSLSTEPPRTFNKQRLTEENFRNSASSTKKGAVVCRETRPMSAHEDFQDKSGQVQTYVLFHLGSPELFPADY